MTVDNHNILLTGASRGIGRALALTLARPGSRLALMARTEEALVQVSQEIKEMGSWAVPITVDITQPKMLDLAIDQALSALDHVDVLINNAGIKDQWGPVCRHC